MTRNSFIRFGLAVLIAFTLLLERTAWAGDDQAAASEGGYVETAVAGRSIAVRLRGEVEFSDSEMSLIEEDANYAAFPATIYNSEIKFIQDDGSSARMAYLRWKNKQGLNMGLWQWKFRFPLQSSDFRDVTESPPFISISCWSQNGHANIPQLTYWYLGIDKTTRSDIFMLLQYRSTVQDGNVNGHELYEYVSWKASDRLNLGEQVAADKSQGRSAISPWYASIFGTVFLVPDMTSLRLDGWYFTSDYVTYQQADAFLTQRIGKRTELRLSWRYYHNNSDLHANAVGIKLKYYFSTRFNVHVGYRTYDHTQSVDLDSFFGGFSLIL
jgi:hypothetical protein